MEKKMRTTTDYDNCCDKCVHYRFIDSGYGRCVRFPPGAIRRAKWFTIWHAYEYPIVPWTNIICGEFTRKHGVSTEAEKK